MYPLGYLICMVLLLRIGRSNQMVHGTIRTRTWIYTAIASRNNSAGIIGT